MNNLAKKGYLTIEVAKNFMRKIYIIVRKQVDAPIPKPKKEKQILPEICYKLAQLLFDKIKEKFYRFTHDSLNSNSLIGNYISKMSKGLDGLLWILTSEGISIINPVNNVFTNLEKKEYPALSDINVIYTDEMGIVWICKSKEGGFVTYNKYKW